MRSKIARWVTGVSLVLILLGIGVAIAVWARSKADIVATTSGAANFIGTVKDSQTQQPIQLATVDLVNTVNQTVVRTSVSDGNGGYNFNNIAYGKYGARPNKTGYVTPDAMNVITLDQANSNHTENLNMEPLGGPIQGIITNEATGAALANVSVVAIDYLGQGDTRTLDSATTAADGSYSLQDNLPAGRTIYLEFTLQGYEDRDETLTLGQGQPTTINTQLKAAQLMSVGKIFGTVKYNDGSPAYNFAVVEGSGLRYAVTDGLGEYKLTQLPVLSGTTTKYKVYIYKTPIFWTSQPVMVYLVGSADNPSADDYTRTNVDLTLTRVFGFGNDR